MTVSLDAISLDASLALLGIKNRPRTAYSARQTILGLGVVQKAPFETGAAIVLEAREESGIIYGRFTGAQVDQIKDLEASTSSVTLVHHLGTWTVQVVETDFREVMDYADPGDTDIYVGTVTMIEV